MRLTYKNHEIEIAKNRKQFEKDVKIVCDKLGQLEDILEKYGIETIEDLDVILAEYFCNVKEHSIKTH